MSFQHKFLPQNIDRKENIVSLCPTCHRAVHLGRLDEKEMRLELLFNKKIKGLKKVGIEIEFEEKFPLTKEQLIKLKHFISSTTTK